jgi:hypothetical protein
MKKMKTSSAIILMILVSAMMFGCGGGGGQVSSGGASNVTIAITGLRTAALSASSAQNGVAIIDIIITAPDIETISRTVPVVGSDAITENFIIPNGANRHFLAIARALDHTVLSQGHTFSDLNGNAKNIEILMGVDVSGEWTFTCTAQGKVPETDFITFTQAGNSLNLVETTIGGSTFNGTGTVIGNSIQFTVVGFACGSPSDLTGTGTFYADGSLNGAFTATGGDSGTWSAVRGHIIPQVNISGAWSVFHSPQGGTEQGPGFIMFNQTVNSMSFTFIDDGGNTKTGSGTVSGNDIQFSFSGLNNCDNTVTISLIGTISADGNTVNGTYTAPGSGNCSEAGTWRATRAQPPASDITGSWSAFHTPQGGTEQGPDCVAFAQVGSFFTLSGAFNGSGILSGSSMQMIFVLNDPTCRTVTHLVGTLTPNGNSLSGTYAGVSNCGTSVGSGTWRAVKGSCTAPQPVQGTVSGTVADALTSAPLAGVSITLSKQGSTIATGTTGTDGTYTLTAPAAGGYSAAFSKSGYITSTFDAITITANAATTLNAVLSPVLSAGQVRIILTWDYSKGNLDLDAHLKGPRAAADTITGPFHTWFGNRTYISAGIKYADLDVDWITPADGPVTQETTTIYQQVSGVYTFYVHDFTNGGSANSSALSNSTAQVSVYIGNNLTATYSVPASQPGTVWTVFQLSGGTLTPINTMSSNETVILNVSQKAYRGKTGKRLR